MRRPIFVLSKSAQDGSHHGEGILEGGSGGVLEGVLEVVLEAFWLQKLPEPERQANFEEN